MAGVISTEPDAYGEFAFAYDQALGLRFFESITKVLRRLIAKYPDPHKVHLDVGCGTGLACQFFENNGFRSTGLDGSAAMLGIARQRARKLVCSDFRQMGLRAKFSRVTCLYDSLNHMLTAEDLTRTFREVRGVMERDALFFFDVNHPSIYPRIWGAADPFVSSDDSHELIMDTTFDRKTQLGVARLTGWALADGRRIKIDEIRRQRAFSREEIERSLHKAGLAPIELIHLDPFHEEGLPVGRGVKWLFVVKPVVSGK